MGFHPSCAVCDIERFGTGVDGDYLQNGGTVTYTGPKHYINCTLENNAVYGPADERAGTLYGQGILDIDVTSKLQARSRVGSLGGAAKVVVGVGNAGGNVTTASASHAFICACPGNGGGGGGGGAANSGGKGGRTNVHVGDPLFGNYGNQRNGAVGNGSNGLSSITPSITGDLDYNSISLAMGLPPSGGGSGGVDDIGTGATTGTSGKGADSRKSGGYLNIRFREIRVAAAGGINANGDDGQDGDDATDSTNLDADCGGGAGSGAGSGGLVRYMCETIDNPGNVQVLGGTRGLGGAGVGAGGTGGDGGDGADGIVAPCVLGT